MNWTDDHQQALQLMAAGIVKMLRDYADLMERGEIPMMQGPKALRMIAFQFESLAEADQDAYQKVSK